MILTAKDVATEILSTNTHYDFFFFNRNMSLFC